MGRAVILLVTFRFGYPVTDYYLIHGGQEGGEGSNTPSYFQVWISCDRLVSHPWGTGGWGGQ